MGTNFFIVFVIMLTLLVCCKHTSLESNKTRTDKISIKNSIKEGMRFDEVESYLKGITTEYSYNEKDMSFYAIVRNEDKGRIVSEDISIVLKMGKNNTLEEINIKSIYTGP